MGYKSPQLSKIFKTHGVPNSVVSSLLSCPTHEKSWVASDRLAAQDQGNSIYYSSCQATDPKAKWSGGTGHRKIHEEEFSIGYEWFMWVVGSPMSIDGKGFKARAKLRLMYDVDGDLKALYIEKPYGDPDLLLQDVATLREWWYSYLCEHFVGRVVNPWDFPIFMDPYWVDAPEDLPRYKVTLYCPSARYGYQDSLVGKGPHTNKFVHLNDFIGNLNKWRPLRRAYKDRQKVGFVRYSSLKECTYIPQRDDVKVPEVILPEQRDPLRVKFGNIVKEIALLGAHPGSCKFSLEPNWDFSFRHNGLYRGQIRYHPKRGGWYISHLERVGYACIFTRRIEDCLEVIQTDSNLGFYLAVSLDSQPDFYQDLEEYLIEDFYNGGMPIE